MVETRNTLSWEDKREKEIIIFTAMTLTGPIRRQDRGGWTPVFFNRHGASDILIA